MRVGPQTWCGRILRRRRIVLTADYGKSRAVWLVLARSGSGGFAYRLVMVFDKHELNLAGGTVRGRIIGA